jgi:spermidine synthase
VGYILKLSIVKKKRNPFSLLNKLLTMTHSVPEVDQSAEVELPVTKKVKLEPLTHPNIKDGWFKETPALWPGQAMSLEVESILHMEQSLYQDILIFKSTTYGHVLVLDGVIQVTERDEMAYQEMITHVPLNCLKNPKKVLVIGGGDGGVLRELLKHTMLESITLCEIDEAVPRLARQYLPGLASALDHPKVTVHIGDGFEFLKNTTPGTYDAIITDSSDPVGPAASLFQDSFFSLLHKALSPEGILCSQGECYWLHLDLIGRVMETNRQLFPSTAYATISMPTYPCGTIGLLLSSKAENMNFEHPQRTVSVEEEEEKYRFYNAQIHQASFQLPTSVRKALQAKLMPVAKSVEVADPVEEAQN